MSLDAELAIAVHDALAHPIADALFGVASMRAGFAVPMLALICAGLYLRWRRDGLITFALLLAILGGADLMGNGLKHLLAQPRPCLELSDLSWMPVPCSGAHRGMPSNHALNYFAVATFLWAALRERRVGLPLVSISCVVGLSRVYLGRHYPSQVLVGALIGSALGLGLAWAFSRTPLGRRIAKSPPGAPPISLSSAESAPRDPPQLRSRSP